MVTRFWLYETEPIKKIWYVITIGPVKTPGQVNDPTDKGNDNFDKGLKKSKFGYSIIAMDQPRGIRNVVPWPEVRGGVQWEVLKKFTTFSRTAFIFLNNSL